MKKFGFPKSKRLVSNRQFRAVLSHRLCARDGLLTVYMGANDCGYPRLGISIGSSRGNAVVRNRLKRLIREAFRQSQDQIPADFDYVLMVSPRWSRRSNETRKASVIARQIKLEEVQASMIGLIKAAASKAG